jgi:nitrous oxidase accessory protein
VTRRASHLPRLVAAALVVLGAQSTLAQSTPEHSPPPAVASTLCGNQGVIGRQITKAQPGDTITIAPGTYRERFVIDKPLTLIGVDHPIIDGEGSGDIVEITAPNVTIRGFTIRNTGIDLDHENTAVRVLAANAVVEANILDDVLFGIDLRDAPRSTIRNNRIGGKKLDIARRGDGLRLWRSDNTLVEGNDFHDGRDAIVWYSTSVTLRRNSAHDCRYGLHLMYSDSVVIEDNTLVGNSVGVYLMYSTGIELRRNILVRNRGPSGYGLGLKEADRFVVRDNLIAQNRVGVYVDGSPFTNKQPGVFTYNTLACNDIGFTFLPSARGSELTENNFIDNIDQVSVAGRGRLDANAFWKGDRGNFWSDYTGYDQNADGVGDFVHESQTLFENMMDKDPKLRLFLFSPAQQAIEFVGRALPAVRPEPKFTDEVPLMRPVPITWNRPGASASSLPLGIAGLSLLAVGGAIALLARDTTTPRRRAATLAGGTP